MPPDPLNLKLTLVVSWRVNVVLIFPRFIVEHSGVPNPSLFLNFRSIRIIKVTFVKGLHVFKSLVQLRSGSTLVLFFLNYTLRRDY